MVKRASDFARSVMSNNLSYHNHKESMGHAALLIQVAIFGAIMTVDYWPPTWIPANIQIQIQISAKTITFLGIFTLWLAIHLYIRWQLRQRRISTFLDSATRVILAKWVTETPKNDDLSVYQKDGTKNKGRLKEYLDYVIPLKSAAMPSEDEKQQYPKAIAHEWDKQARCGISPIRAERLVAIGSALMFLLVLIRTFMANDP